MQESSRRQFLYRLSTAIGLVPALRVKGALLGVRSSAELVDGTEPGQRLVVSGTLFGPEGKPLPEARLRVYHTDAEGYYSRPVSDPRRARISGSVVSDAGGRYELRSILPGHYPGREAERHIHVHLLAEGHPEHWIDSFLFEGDPYVRAGELARSQAAGRFGHVMAIQRDGDVLRCRRDIRLDPTLAERNRLVNGWYRQ